eukprot:gene22444-biopygen1173
MIITMVVWSPFPNTPYIYCGVGATTAGARPVPHTQHTWAGHGHCRPRSPWRNGWGRFLQMPTCGTRPGARPLPLPGCTSRTTARRMTRCASVPSAAGRGTGRTLSWT